MNHIDKVPGWIALLRARLAVRHPNPLSDFEPAELLAEIDERSKAQRILDQSQRAELYALRELCGRVLDVIDTTDSESPKFLDSGADSIEALCEVGEDIKQALNGTRPPAAQTTLTMRRAAEFIEGFEDDQTQEGVADLLADLRAGIAHRDRMADALDVVLRALDRIAQGEDCNSVIEETGATAIATEARRDHVASPLVEELGFSIHGPGGQDDGEDLQGRYWWTLFLDGWSSAESSPDSFASYGAAVADAEQKLLSDVSRMAGALDEIRDRAPILEPEASSDDEPDSGFSKGQDRGAWEAGQIARRGLGEL